MSRRRTLAQEQIDIRLQAAIDRRVFAQLLFEHASDTHDHAATQLASLAIEQAGVDIAALTEIRRRDGNG